MQTTVQCEYFGCEEVTLSELTYAKAGILVGKVERIDLLISRKHGEMATLVNILADCQEKNCKAAKKVTKQAFLLKKVTNGKKKGGGGKK